MMTTSRVSALLALGVVLVIGSLLLRVSSGGKYEIKTGDLVFLVIPLLLAALATGKLKGLDLFGVKADLSALWAEAAQTKIEGQVAQAAPATVQDVVQAVEMASKGGLDELQQLIKRRTEALEFKLGYGVYYAPAIKTYFDALFGSSYLRTVVVNSSDGALFGIFKAADLIGYLRVTGEEGYNKFQRLLNDGGESARLELSKMPGFVGAEHAVTTGASKRDTLALMEKLGVDSIPVVDEHRRFIGSIERAKLTASLILAVTDKIENR